jgi:deoxyribonuclease V
MAKGSVLDPAEVSFFGDLQRFIRRKEASLPKDVSRICAVDAAYRGDRVVAAASVFEGEELRDEECYAGRCSIPYVSGLFYLREGPFVVEAVRRLKVRPQLLCFDAHGAAHPRSAGLATICGMVLGIPSVGIAKSLLVGRVATADGGLARITYGGRTVGFAAETNGVTRYWSPGYSVGLADLRSVMHRYAVVCLQAIRESDRATKGRIRNV